MRTVDVPIDGGKSIKLAELRPADHWAFVDETRSMRLTQFSRLCYQNKVGAAEFGRGAAAIMAERIDIATELQGLPGQILLLWLSAKRADPKIGPLEVFRQTIPNQDWIGDAFIAMQSLSVREGENIEREAGRPLDGQTGPQS